MNIFLRLEMVGVCRAASLSLRVCQTLGNGETIRWRIGTPRGGRGRGGEGGREGWRKGGREERRDGGREERRE